MTDKAKNPGYHSPLPDWYMAMARFEVPDYRYAIWQLCTTIIPELGILAFMVYLVTLGYSYWLVLLLRPSRLVCLPIIATSMTIQ